MSGWAKVGRPGSRRNLLWAAVVVALAIGSVLVFGAAAGLTLPVTG
jgi:hypothetical protein